MKQIGNVQFIFMVCRQFRWLIVSLFCMSVVWSIDLSLRPYVLKVILDRVSAATQVHDASVLIFPAAFYMVLWLGITLLFRLYDYVWMNLNPPMKRYIGKLLMGRMMLHSHTLYQEHFAGGLANRIKDVMSTVPDLLKIVVDRFFSNTLSLFVAIATVSMVNVIFAFLLCIWIAIFLLGVFYFSRTARLLSNKAAYQRSNVMGIIVDILGNMMGVRLFCGRAQEKTNMHVVLTDYMISSQNRDWCLLKLFAFQGISFVIYNSICLGILVSRFHYGLVSAGDFALILTVNTTLIHCLWSLSRDISKFAEGVGEVSQGLSIALSPLEITDVPNAKQLTVSEGRIIFDRVKFQYTGAEALFHDESVVIEAGQKVGLVGYSGGGKTTFINLILRIYDITEGRILIDGQNIREVTQESLRCSIGTIPQEPSLFHRSVIENIRYGNPDASDELVKAAAEKAHAHEFILRLPEGYNTVVGERGARLSGGQRQRIAMARAILKNAPILILDEATSQLDSVTEMAIQKSLDSLMMGKTALVVAHRLSTLLQMDRILVFDKGQIVQDGTHDDLLHQNGLYKTLWSAQVGGFISDEVV